MEHGKESVSEQDEISGLETVGWEMIHGNTCLESVKKESSILNERRSTSFQILYCVLVRYTRTQSNDAPEDRLGGSKLLQNTETLTESTASQWTRRRIFSQDSIRCSSVTKSNVCC